MKFPVQKLGGVGQEEPIAAQGLAGHQQTGGEPIRNITLCQRDFNFVYMFSRQYQDGCVRSDQIILNSLFVLVQRRQVLQILGENLYSTKNQSTAKVSATVNMKHKLQNMSIIPKLIVLSVIICWHCVLM